MTNAERTSIAAIPPILAVGVGIAWAGSHAGVHAGGAPLFALCGIFSFAINWLVFVPSYFSQSDRCFDLTGSFTYLCLVFAALVFSDGVEARAVLLGAMVSVWAVRLGRFLFARIRRDGADGRFDRIKTSFPRFLMAWTLQGLWVFLTLACALAAMTTTRPQPLGALALLGTLLWIAGFGLETLADNEKRRFREAPENHDRFIQSGSWAWSQHPNYLGEITLWLGVSLIALPVLTSWQYATLISPIFVYVLLTRISGIPLLESRANRKWGDDPEYRAYRDRTPVLFPRAPRSA